MLDGVNPFIESYGNMQGGYGIPSISAPSQSVNPGRITNPTMIAQPQTNSTNAAGTSENVSLHTAYIIVFALFGIWFLKHNGFAFVRAV